MERVERVVDMSCVASTVDCIGLEGAECAESCGGEANETMDCAVSLVPGILEIHDDGKSAGPRPGNRSLYDSPRTSRTGN